MSEFSDFSGRELFVLLRLMEFSSISDGLQHLRFRVYNINAILESIRYKLGADTIQEMIEIARQKGITYEQLENDADKNVLISHLADIAIACGKHVDKKIVKSRRIEDEEKLAAAWKKYYQEKEKIDKMRSQLRSKLYNAIRTFNHRGGPRANRPKGIDWDSVILHLGPCPGPRNEWHIDHIRPLSSFDLSDPEQVRRACLPDNFQWLPAKENLKKGALYDKSH
jgi:hypothetical protein